MLLLTSVTQDMFLVLLSYNYIAKSKMDSITVVDYLQLNLCSARQWHCGGNTEEENWLIEPFLCW